MTIARALVITAVIAVAAPARSATIYVGNNGRDSTLCGFDVIGGFTCGASTSPCRSISCAIREAAAGDTIIVGPGRYGDLDRDGVIGETGEERGAAGCGCMLAVNKSVDLVSSHGAAATIIDAQSVNVAKNVLLVFDGGEFGRPDKGFTVTGTADDVAGDGIVVDASDVKVRGNQVVAGIAPTFATDSVGIETITGPGAVLIEGNQVLAGWGYGMIVNPSNKTVRRNHVSGSRYYGIFATSTAILGNVATGNGFGGIAVDASTGPSTVLGNAVYGNEAMGITLYSWEGGSLHNNNIFGNGCGLFVNGTGAIATNNYWGKATAPTPGANDLCGDEEEATTTPFATKAFSIDPPLRP